MNRRQVRHLAGLICITVGLVLLCLAGVLEFVRWLAR